MSINACNYTNNGVETIIPQAYMSVVLSSNVNRRRSGSRVRVCKHGLWPMLNADPCLWLTAPLQLQVVACGAMSVLSLYH